jgi:hypothetical protein
LADANVSEKHAVSIFRAEMAMLGVKGFKKSWDKRKLAEWADQERGNCRENLKSQTVNKILLLA